jgi:hypothetical protein
MPHYARIVCLYGGCVRQKTVYSHTTAINQQMIGRRTATNSATAPHLLHGIPNSYVTYLI